MWKNIFLLGCECAFLCWSREASWRQDSKVLLLGLFVLLEITSVTVSETAIASCVSVRYTWWHFILKGNLARFSVAVPLGKPYCCFNVQWRNLFSSIIYFYHVLECCTTNDVAVTDFIHSIESVQNIVHAKVHHIPRTIKKLKNSLKQGCLQTSPFLWSIYPRLGMEIMIFPWQISWRCSDKTS